MLKRNKRLSQKDQIEAILKEGIECKDFGLICRKLPNTVGFDRYGIVISSKLEKSAVKRNRLRRQIFECIHQQTRNAAEAPPTKKEDAKTATFDIMLFVRKSLLNRPYPEIQKMVQSMIKKAHESK